MAFLSFVFASIAEFFMMVMINHVHCQQTRYLGLEYLFRI